MTDEAPAADKTIPEKYKGLGYHELNAMLNLYGADGKIQFDADKRAAREYFLQHVNTNTVFFHDLEEKLEYLVENNFYESEVLDLYDFAFIKACFKQAYAHKFRFRTFLGAYKYYTMYTLRSNDGTRILERFEDRVVMVALTLATLAYSLPMLLESLKPVFDDRSPDADDRAFDGAVAIARAFVEAAVARKAAKYRAEAVVMAAIAAAGDGRVLELPMGMPFRSAITAWRSPTRRLRPRTCRSRRLPR